MFSRKDTDVRGGDMLKIVMKGKMAMEVRLSENLGILGATGQDDRLLKKQQEFKYS
jgi:hypothetical protein